MEIVARQVLMCIARWASTKDEFDSIALGGILHNWEAPLVRDGRKAAISILRAPPSIGVLKFNMDGATRGKPEPAIIRVVLCNNSLGHVLRMFSKHVGH